MAVVVVGGHSRNIGKTSVVAGLIRALPHLRWTAIKVTQFGHGMCSADGQPCACETGEHTVGISEERGLRPETDSGRFLEAGAERALWVRTRQGQLFAAMPRVRAEMARAGNVIFESNSILQFLRPDLYLTVVDPGIEDFKVSARRYLDRADAVVVTGGGEVADGPAHLLRGKPRFPVEASSYMSAELAEFVACRVEVCAA